MKPTQNPIAAGQRIAVIGSGISGLTSAYLLSQKHDVTLFEANDYIGGHTHTVPVEMDGVTHMVDTGFIVCNNRNYPNFLKLMARLGIELQPTEMSFSVTNPALDLEYNGHSLNSLFAQRLNLLRPSFYRLLSDIMRFNKAAKALLAEDAETEGSLNEYLESMKFGALFRDNYLLPMVAAIWSCSIRQAGEFPLKLLLRFFNNHGLLDISGRPQWYVLKGGSHSYIPALTRPFSANIRLNCPVQAVSRKPEQTSPVQITNAQGTESFDHVIMACHSDQALALLEQPTTAEQQVLGSLRYQMNEVVLHQDSGLMPKRQGAWASWNFSASQPNDTHLPCVTYCMNILQGIRSSPPLLVTLNANDKIAEDKIIQRFRYAHPVYDQKTVMAQQRRNEICGIDNIHFCGAYWYNGFHEDGVCSALDVCQRFGARL
jgi:hypothetical protein